MYLFVERVKCSHTNSLNDNSVTIPPLPLLVQALVCIHKLCLTSEQMARALVKRDLHLLLFSMIYDWRGRSLEREEGEKSQERGREEERETSAVPSSPGHDEVENERDCECRVWTSVSILNRFLGFTV